jgi:3-methyladenine DNA glycosylase AlkD
MNATIVKEKLEELSSPQRLEGATRYFKTKPGQYGSNDLFLGVTVPSQRKVAKQCGTLSLSETAKLLQSPYHECRATALFILVEKYHKGTLEEQQKIYTVYMTNIHRVNNWDLVDSSAEHIVGSYLGDSYKVQLTKLAASPDLWERRIAMLACFHSIKLGDSGPALYIIELLKNDREDLIQKAVGWMLREIGKRCSRDILYDWLVQDRRYTTLPRTTLRYAIEHFGPDQRKAFLSGTV